MARLAHLLGVAILLALPTGGAAGDTPHYLAQALEADGNAGAVGPLAAALVRGTNTGETPWFQLTADSLRIERDRRYDPTAGMVWGPTSLVQDDTNWTSREFLFDDASASLTGTRPPYRIFIVPEEGVEAPRTEVYAPFLRMTVSAAEPVGEPENIQHPDREPRKAAVADSFGIINEGRTVLRVSGSFLVVLWEADLHVRDARGGSSFPSGDGANYTVNATTPFGWSMPLMGTSESFKTYVHVHNGTLDFSVADAHWESLYLHVKGAAAGGELTLKGALPQDGVGLPQTSAGNDLKFKGPVACNLAASGQWLDVWFVEQRTASHTGGPAADALHLLPSTQVPAASPSATAVSWSAVPSWLGPSALLLVVAAVALVALRLASQARAMRSLRGHMEAGEYEAAVEKVEGPLRSRRHRREASVIGIVAALQLADVARARELLRRARRSLESDPALEPFLDACIAAASHDEERARALLRDSLRMDGSLLAHARGNPFLSRVLQPEPQEPGYT